MCPTSYQFRKVDSEILGDLDQFIDRECFGMLHPLADGLRGSVDDESEHSVLNPFQLHQTDKPRSDDLPACYTNHLRPVLKLFFLPCFSRK